MTEEERKLRSQSNEELDVFLNYGLPKFNQEKYTSTYQSWAKGGFAWDAISQGGTGIMLCLMWYQHVHKPGSKEWRPSIIIRAARQAAREFAEAKQKEQSVV